MSAGKKKALYEITQEKQCGDSKEKAHKEAEMQTNQITLPLCWTVVIHV